MSQIATIEPQRVSLIGSMAQRYGMEPKAFADTVRSTCMPHQATNEEFAAFLLVAREYDLNPVTREIYAFPKKGGGIQPIVGIDGWMNIINSQPQCDGMEFDDEFNDKRELVSVTCRIYRKDRSRPVSVTEYMDECKRTSEPWQKWPKRMLRHKAAIQCARYAFGLAGIIDPDEAERSPEVITTNLTVAPPPPPAGLGAQTITFDPAAGTTDAEIDDGDQGDEPFDATTYFEELETAAAGAHDAEGLEEVFTEFDPGATFDGDDTNLAIADAIKTRRLKQIAEGK